MFDREDDEMASSNYLRHHEGITGGLSVKSMGRPALRFSRTQRIEPRFAWEDGVSASGLLNAGAPTRKR